MVYARFGDIQVCSALYTGRGQVYSSCGALWVATLTIMLLLRRPAALVRWMDGGDTQRLPIRISWLVTNLSVRCLLALNPRLLEPELGVVVSRFPVFCPCAEWRISVSCENPVCGNFLLLVQPFPQSRRRLPLCSCNTFFLRNFRAL